MMDDQVSTALYVVIVLSYHCSIEILRFDFSSNFN